MAKVTGMDASDKFRSRPYPVLINDLLPNKLLDAACTDAICM